MKYCEKLMFILLVFAALLIFSPVGTAHAEGDPDFDMPLGALPPPPYPVDNPTLKKNVWPSPMGPKQELGYLQRYNDIELHHQHGPQILSP